jgi:very-short-patch-repair endonuclease
MNQIEELRRRLESRELFQPLFEDFLRRSITAQKEEETDPLNPYNFSSFYEMFIDNYARINTDIVFECCESPIERIFINSLTLLFLKNKNMELHVTPPLADIEQAMCNYRKNHRDILGLIARYKEKSGDNELINFEQYVQRKIDSGRYKQGDFEIFEHHRFVIDNFIWNSYHLSLQAGFPNYKVDGKSIRADILVWCPGNEKIKLIVECDGYEYHSSKESFEKDRKRDRLLKSKGYDVIRFSGSEIFRDPVKVSSDLYDFIEDVYGA